MANELDPAFPPSSGSAPLRPGDFAVLEVADVNRIGAFLKWGQPKDLFLPFAEQTKPLHPGDGVLVFLYIDNTERICASMRVERNTDSSMPDYEVGDAVELLIATQTDIGFKAIVDGRYLGLLYKDEIFRPLSYAQSVRGYVKKVRPEDGKIDLQLTDPLSVGHKSADPVADLILERLRASPEGFLKLNDKSPAEEIYQVFGVSRKKFKIALGGLYKRRVLTVEPDGIRLVTTGSSPAEQT